MIKSPVIYYGNFSFDIIFFEDYSYIIFDMEIKILDVSKKRGVFYEVMFGDDYEKISHIFSVPVQYIKQNNPGELYRGKVLFLPETNFLHYVVQPFDTLLKIAEKFNVSVDSLKTKNALTTDFVFVGQRLFV